MSLLWKLEFWKSKFKYHCIDWQYHLKFHSLFTNHFALFTTHNSLFSIHQPAPKNTKTQLRGDYAFVCNVNYIHVDLNPAEIVQPTAKKNILSSGYELLYVRLTVCLSISGKSHLSWNDLMESKDQNWSCADEFFCHKPNSGQCFPKHKNKH